MSHTLTDCLNAHRGLHFFHVHCASLKCTMLLIFALTVVSGSGSHPMQLLCRSTAYWSKAARSNKPPRCSSFADGHASNPGIKTDRTDRKDLCISKSWESSAAYFSKKFMHKGRFETILMSSVTNIPSRRKSTKIEECGLSILYAISLGFKARGGGKVTTGIAGSWQPSVHSDVAFYPSMSALPIIQKQNSVSVGLFTH
ncbi:hypothetical protein VTP01DRAFT_2876 [Rhizomucor pusillus]